MADYHIREIRADGRVATVVFHIPVPVGSNRSGISFRAAVSESGKRKNNSGGFDPITSEMQSISAAEATGLANGSLIEVSENIKFLAADTNAEKLVKVEAAFTVTSARILARIQQTLKFYNKSGTVK